MKVAVTIFLKSGNIINEELDSNIIGCTNSELIAAVEKMTGLFSKLKQAGNNIGTMTYGDSIIDIGVIEAITTKFLED